MIACGSNSSDNQIVRNCFDVAANRSHFTETGQCSAVGTLTRTGDNLSWKLVDGDGVEILITDYDFIFDPLQLQRIGITAEISGKYEFSHNSPFLAIVEVYSISES